MTTAEPAPVSEGCVHCTGVPVVCVVSEAGTSAAVPGLLDELVSGQDLAGG